MALLPQTKGESAQNERRGIKKLLFGALYSINSGSLARKDWKGFRPKWTGRGEEKERAKVKSKRGPGATLT